MSEVWIFRGTQPVLWRIPVRVTLRKRAELTRHRLRHSGELVHFEPAVPLLGCQRVALHDFFAGHQLVERMEGYWRFKRHYRLPDNHIAAMGGMRATSDDPEDHLVWGARRPPAAGLTRETRARLAWLEEMLARGVGESVEQLEFFWRGFCLHLAHTLLNREEPVDCYFFKLHNCPLRTGWREYLMARGGKPPKEPRHALRRVMEGGLILAFDVAGEHALRHIEVEHTPEWWKLVRRVEGQRRQRLGPEDYARKFQRSLERFALTAWHLFWINRQEMAQGHGRRVAHGRRGGFRFVPEPVARSVRGEAYKLGRTPTRATLKHLRHAIASFQKALSGAHGGVPAVSGIRPAAEAVRESAHEGSGPAVGQSGDGAGGGDGVLLRPHSEELVRAGEVLAARAGVDGDGVAGGT